MSASWKLRGVALMLADRAPSLSEDLKQIADQIDAMERELADLRAKREAQLSRIAAGAGHAVYRPHVLGPEADERL